MQTSIKRSELKAHLPQVAASLFYSDGIHAIGVDRIAGEAGVTKRTLYHHYESKDELIAAALRKSPIVSFPQDGAAPDRILGAFERLREFLADTAARITGLPERTARRILNRACAYALLASDTPKGPVSLRFPAEDAEAMFPRLFAAGA